MSINNTDDYPDNQNLLQVPYKSTTLTISLVTSNSYKIDKIKLILVYL